MAFCMECFKTIDENYSYLRLFCDDNCYSNFINQGGVIRKCPKCNKFEAIDKPKQRGRIQRASKDKIDWCIDCYELYWFEKDEKERQKTINLKKEDELNKKLSPYKKCKRCKEEKLKTFFDKSKSKDGLKECCKDCEIEKNELKKQAEKYINKKYMEKIKFYKDLEKANKNIELEKRRFNIMNPYTSNIK